MRASLFSLAVLALVVASSPTEATTSQGKSGFQFIGFSADNERIAYLKYYEHYGHFNNAQDYAYYRDYIGTYLYRVQEHIETKYSKDFNFKVPGFHVHTWMDDDPPHPDEHGQLERRFEARGAQVLLDGKIIFESVMGARILSTFLTKNHEKALLHLQVAVTDEHFEVLMLCDLASGKIETQVSTSDLLER